MRRYRFCSTSPIHMYKQDCGLYGTDQMYNNIVFSLSYPNQKDNSVLKENDVQFYWFGHVHLSNDYKRALSFSYDII